MAGSYWPLVGAAVIAAVLVWSGSKDEAKAQARHSDHEARLRTGVFIDGTYRTPQGTLVRLSIPSRSFRGNPAFDETCFVWRDVEFRTATLHCPPHDTLTD